MSSTTTTKKRKSDGATTAASKKAKSTAAANAQFVEGILTDASNFELPREGNATRETILQLAQYARSLEEELNSMRPKEKSPTEVAAAATKLAAAARSGITKQMTWKPACKTGSAKWVYDGVCSDPKVFGALFGIDGPPTFKMKKYTADEFQGFVGEIEASVRYDSLSLKSDVNVRWNPTEGTFKFSGSYGK